MSLRRGTMVTLENGTVLNIQGPGSVLDMCRNISFHSPTFLRGRELLGFLFLKQGKLRHIEEK